MPHLLLLVPATTVFGLAWLLHAAAAEPPKPLPPDHAAKMAKGAALFKSHVGPLLKANCLRCHGGKKTEGGLDLSNRDTLLKGGEKGPGVIPGDAKKSLLYLLAAHLQKPHMPEGGDKLPPDALTMLAEWIDLGAAYDVPLRGPDPKTKLVAATTHWAFQPLKKPAIPTIQNPPGQVHDPIDRFVLTKLEEKGLKPAAMADKRTLVRRVSFDLTGLPPTPEEVEAFVVDGSPDAYAKLIDRLLASRAYGERWGRHWLDLVRYCDSFDARGVGGAEDCADAWRYRDWVVRAINADVPYDKFVRMQVAGDVLPLAEVERVDGVVATGMLAIGNWGGGDADKEKLLTDIADDQVDVVARTVMGLTLACARCHDHKFDPLTTKDYYALAGIFFSSHVLPSVGPKTNGPPMLRVPLDSPADQKARAEFEQRIKTAESSLLSLNSKSRKAASERLRTELPGLLLAVHDLGDDTHDGAKLDALATTRGIDVRWARIAATGLSRPTGTVLAKHFTDVAGKKGLHSWRNDPDCPNVLVNTTSAEARFTTIVMPARSVALHPGPASDVAAVWTSPVSTDVEIRGSVTDFDPTCGDGVTWEVRHVSAAGATTKVTSGSVENGRTAEFGKSLKVKTSIGDRILLVIGRKAEYSCDTTGVELIVRSDAQTWNLSADWLGGPLPTGTAKLGPWSVEDLGKVPALPAKLTEAATAWSAARTKFATKKLDRAAFEQAAQTFATVVAEVDGGPFLPAGVDGESYFDVATRTELTRLRSELTSLRKELAAPRATANATQEGGVPGSPHAGVHDVKVHVRGRYDRLGDLVPRGFPEVIKINGVPKITTGSGRKELADWLTRPDHPLTARVIVNRLWQHHLGRGIVTTPNNFGLLGARPTHPELLDYLAATFIEDGWSLKKLHRRILLSATYRQSAEGDPGTRATDPDNAYFGRYPRRRLEAEAIRDSLLVVAGKLEETRGGLATRDFNSPRRTLYLMTIRSDRTGFGPLFDAADSTAPVDVRTVSTIAPQALFLLNHPFTKAQAAAFADRVMKARSTDGERLDLAHQIAFGRLPTPEERQLGAEFLATSKGSREAWVAWCHLLIQANEFVMVE